MPPPLTLALLALNALAYLAQLGTGGASGALTRAGLLYGPAVAAGEIWRLVGSAFLHGGLLHVGLNMYFLYVFGPQLERAFGAARFALIYAGALFGGALAVMLIDWDRPTLGASGAVLGLAAATAVAMSANGIDPRRSPVFGLVVLNLALPLLVPVISFSGHLGGVLGGALLAWLLLWQPLRGRPRWALSTARAAALGAVLALALASLLIARVGGLAGVG